MVRRTVGQVADAAVVAEQTGRGGRDLLRSVVDDMRGTPPFREVPWPSGPAFQSYADRVADTSLSGAFNEAADKLLAASLRST